MKNGNVSIWDKRKQNQAVKTFNSHLGTVKSVDWHATKPNLLLSGGQDNLIKLWDVSKLDSTELKSQSFLKAPNSIKKAAWVNGEGNEMLITSISASENRLSIWHTQKPHLQQYILKGPTLTESLNVQNDCFQDFEWIKPGESLVGALGPSIIFYDLLFYKSEARSRLYADDSYSRIVRPYAKMTTNVADFNLNDEIIMVQQPIRIASSVSKQPVDFDYANKFMKSLDELAAKDKVN